MAHVLKAKDRKALEATYVGKAYLNETGNAECVEFIRQTLQAPQTDLWREGAKVEKGSDIAIGTAIATFVDKKYPQAGNTGKHAAIYLGQNSLGIQVLDQWKAQGEVRVRTIRWVPAKAGLSNDGKAFSTIEW